MTLRDLVEFMRQQPWAVQATVSDSQSPQAAVIGVAITDRGELFFDTLSGSRKCCNLRERPEIAVVIGWDDARTVQYEGVADEPTGEELEDLLALYFERFPDGRARQSWPDIAYFRVRPRWMRFSDFRGPEAVDIEFDEADLVAGD